jgi:translation initiation factor 2 subunit 3
MDKQPIINIGMLGSVSDGKSTTVHSMTGVKTQKHSNEMKRNITIKPGYANMKIYKSNETSDSSHYNIKKGELVHHVSFIDCPGHYQLIVTMLSCIKLMDGIILVVSAAEPIEKKPQLIQHIMAIKISGIKNVIVLLNKLDLIKKPVALERYKKLVELLNKYEIEPKIIIPVCMNHSIGVDVLLQSIMKYMPPRINRIDRIDSIDSPNSYFMISRSFDINKVNINALNLVGGVVGGSLISGSFKVGDEIEILPGIINKNSEGNLIHKSHYTKIISLKSEITDLDVVEPGGLIGIGTNIDPFYCKNDKMIGMVIGLKGTLPPVYYTIKVKYTELDSFSDNKKWIKFKGVPVIVIIGTNCVDSNIINVNDNIIELKLVKPVCIDNDMIVLCDKTLESFNIVGYGYLTEDNIETIQTDIPVLNEQIKDQLESKSSDSDSDFDIDDI